MVLLSKRKGHPRESSGLPDPKDDYMWYRGIYEIEKVLRMDAEVRGHLITPENRKWYQARLKELKTLKLIGVNDETAT